MAKGKKRTARIKGANSVAPKKSTTAAPQQLTRSAPAANGSRKLSRPFKRTPKQERPVFKSVVGAPRLFVRSCRFLSDNWKLFSVIMVIYAAVYIIMVGGLSSSNLNATKSTLLSDHTGNLAMSSTLFASLLSSGNNGNTAAGAYQTILIIVISLVLIWALRQLYAGHAIRARDAFYKGTYPLVPFILVLLIIALQLLPLVFGGALYNAVIINGIVSGAFPTMVVIAIAIALATLSFYWICSSLIALYIVTLPDMTPLEAIRSARDLVRFRRWVVLRKLLFLPLTLLIFGAIILMPIARYATTLSVFVFFLLAIIAIAVIHSYMYALYRELL
jgi:hypothetical protein